MLYCEADKKLVEESKELLKLTEDYPTYAKERRLFSALVRTCTEDYSLVLDNGMTIPAKYVSVAFNTGKIKLAEALCRVGRLTHFVLIKQGDDYIPSRYDAQVDALKELGNKLPGAILDGVVTYNSPFGAFVDIGSGVSALLPTKLQCIAKNGRTNIRFPAYMPVKVVLHKIDSEGHITLTTIPLLGDFDENIAHYLSKPKLVGHITGVKEFGTFVELGYNLVGLTNGSSGDYHEGDFVAVHVVGRVGPGTKLRLEIERHATKEESQEEIFWSVPSDPNLRITKWEYCSDDRAPVPPIFVDYEAGVGFGL